MMSKVKITETIFRDAHQSLMATRMKTEEMLPIAKELDKVGYHSLEVWGGATFDACLRFLNEDPWERLRKLRKAMPNTKLQMLLRGQNILGYKHYPDDVVEEFVKKTLGNGIDIIRIFDALNDERNLMTAIEATKKNGGHAQCAISYTTSPIHNIDYYVKKAKSYENAGADSICIKDMAGILLPYDAEKLIKSIKSNTNLMIQVHSHFTSGIANQMYMKAVESGADVIDTALSPFGNGSSQPATESMVASLQNSKYDTGLDLNKLNDIADYFRKVRKKAEEADLINQKVLDINIKTLLYQVPGGMLSNLVSQLKQQGQLDKLEAVLEEVPNVRKDLGYPPLVTPMSQMVGTQAVFNIIMGERYKVIPNEIRNYVKGLYGKSTVEIDEDIVKKIIGDEVRFDGRPADLLEPQLEQYREEIKELIEQDEDVLSYALFPQVAKKFFKERNVSRYQVDEVMLYLDDDNETYPV